jgi:hypothetical protein
MVFDSMGVLKSHLLELLRECDRESFPLILAGGFGLYLHQINLQERVENYQPLIAGDFWPRPRTTEDMDLLIRTEFIADETSCLCFRSILNKLGYQPASGAEYYQFVRQSERGQIKIDLLTGPIPDLLRDRLKIDERRVRPKGLSGQLHAHPADEALGFDKNLQELPIKGICPDGEAYKSAVYIPQAATFILMKLFAFRDRLDDAQKDLGRHHAMDLYRVMAMMNYETFEQAKATLRETHEDESIMEKARRIVAENFTKLTSPGLIRLREHSDFQPEMTAQLPEFMRALQNLLGLAE